MKKLLNFLFITSLFICTSLFAQHDFRSGYVITNDNDTLKGFIDNNPEQENSAFCNFKRDLTDPKVIIYGLNEIKEYEFTGGKHYIAKELNLGDLKGSFLAECVSRGVISLYYIKNVSLKYYFIEDKDSVYELRNDEVNYVVDGRTFTKKSDQYKRMLSFVMRDTPSIFPDIVKTDFNRQSLSKLLEKYHQKINSDKTYILYSKETKSDKAKWILKIGASAGLNVTFLKSEIGGFVGGYNFVIDGHLKKVMPRVTESNVPLLYNNQSIYKTVSTTVSPGIFFNLSNNSRYSIQFELNYIRRKYAFDNFSIITQTFNAPFLFKREFDYYKKIRYFFDLGFALCYNSSFTTNLMATVESPYVMNNDILYNTYTYTVTKDNSEFTKVHFAALGGVGISYFLTERNKMDFEFRLDYTQDRFSAEFDSHVSINSKFRYLNSAIITRITF